MDNYHLSMNVTSVRSLLKAVVPLYYSNEQLLTVSSLIFFFKSKIDIVSAWKRAL